ncbi:hypothetical protein D6C99_08067 [Aureobasidium pullulans]|nr:hypothetical protein D6C99_08067 [Aureobasidium pullulans]
MFMRFDGYDRQPGYVFGIRRAVSGLVAVYRSRADVALMCSTFGSGGWVL